VEHHIAVFSDVHADLRALESVITDARGRGIARIWNLGDFASGGPQPVECFELCMAECELNLLGNHEAFVFAEVWGQSHQPWALAAEYASRCLGAERVDRLRGLTPHARTRSPLIEVVHGTLIDPGMGFMRSEADAYLSLQRASSPFLLCGHTHRWAAFLAAANGVPQRAGLKLDDTFAITDRAVLNPGAACDSVGARWLEISTSADELSATWRKTTVRGHGGGWGPDRLAP
jgi:hypothetical protein